MSRDVPPPIPTQNPPVVPAAMPYFPPPPTEPIIPSEHLHEARIASPVSTISTPPTSPEGLNNKSVNFAPLSPTSSRRLHDVHDAHMTPPKRSQTYDPKATDWDTDDNVYDDPSSPDERQHHRHHRRRRHLRRNSDPSSNRPSSSRRRRRSGRNRSSSPADSDSSEVENLPDRFDRDGRPLNRDGNRESEMVERVVRDFGDVVDGRKSWKDLLGDLVQAGRGEGGRDRR